MTMTNEIQFYFGLLPTVVGYLIYASTLYFMLKGKRNSMWTSFTVGSFLMASGLLTGFFMPEREGFDLFVVWVLSAIAWVVFGGILLCNYYVFDLDNIYTSKEIDNILDSCLSIESEGLVGYWAVWDQRSSKAQGFKYGLIEVYETSTPLNGLRKQQHYRKRNIDGGFDSIEQVKEYHAKLTNTPVKVG